MKSFDPKQESKHIIYLDANNLHGNGMSEFLPISGFKRIDRKEFDLNKYTSQGSILEVDLEYPKELRELHKNYPLAPDKNRNQKRNVAQLPIKDCWSL